MNLAMDAVRRRVRLNPRDPDFFNDPYPAYAAIRETAPVFFWEDYGFWCFARLRRLPAAARHRRFGREILHVMSCAELSWPEPKPHLSALRRARKAFDPRARAARAHAAPGASSIAPSSRAASKSLRPKSPRWRTSGSYVFAPAVSAELIAEFAGPIPARRHCRPPRSSARHGP